MSKFTVSHSGATKEEEILLVNAERFMMSVPCKNRWELETECIKNESKKVLADGEKIKDDMKKLQAKYNDLTNQNESLLKSCTKANLELDYAWNKLVLILCLLNIFNEDITVVLF